MRLSCKGMAFAAAVVALGLGGCASRGGLRMDHCEVRVVRLERWDVQGGGARVAYQVAGRAGSPGKVWLAARNASGTYVSGRGAAVGPGPYAAVVGIELDRLPQKFVAVLDVAGRRCRADATMPSR